MSCPKAALHTPQLIASQLLHQHKLLMSPSIQNVATGAAFQQPHKPHPPNSTQTAPGTGGLAAVLLQLEVYGTHKATCSLLQHLNKHPTRTQRDPGFLYNKRQTRHAIASKQMYQGTQATHMQPPPSPSSNRYKPGTSMKCGCCILQQSAPGQQTMDVRGNSLHAQMNMHHTCAVANRVPQAELYPAPPWNKGQQSPCQHCCSWSTQLSASKVVWCHAWSQALPRPV